MLRFDSDVREPDTEVVVRGVVLTPEVVGRDKVMFSLLKLLLLLPEVPVLVPREVRLSDTSERTVRALP